MPPPANPFRILTISKSVPPSGGAALPPCVGDVRAGYRDTLKLCKPKKWVFFKFFFKGRKTSPDRRDFLSISIEKRDCKQRLFAVFRLSIIVISNSFQKSSEIVMVLQIYFGSNDICYWLIDVNFLQIILMAYIDIEIRPYKEQHRNGSKHP